MRKTTLFLLFAGIGLLVAFAARAREYHVSVRGSDEGDGSVQRPYRTIRAASRKARAGDTVTVHEGTYREWVNPLYGGTSDFNRILYRAAPGEKVVVTGSDIIKNWKKVAPGVWMVTLDNTLFGHYNPYRDTIGGDWFLGYGRIHHTGEVYLNGRSFFETDSLQKVLDPRPLKGAQDQAASLYQWYCRSDHKSTTIWANFHDADPNREVVEINVRPAVFYPKQTGISYITVRGFILKQAATNWAPPTAEQTGLIGPHWSKGWIIEDNVISDSKCSGISLGADRITGQNFSSLYKIKSGHISQLETVFNALRYGWSRETVGSHIIRNNVIFSCGQAGICGDLGAIFSQIYNNDIFNIYTKRQWGGFEMAGIKLHAAIDVLIRHNRIHNAFKGIWIDWEAQGIRISRNLLYDNSWMDLHLEVNHGPQIIDNNCFLSALNLWDLSTGSAFINNLFAGQICRGTENVRFTPYHYPHSTKIAGIMTTQGGDDSYFDNLFIKTPMPPYDIFEHADRPKRKKEAMGFGLGMYAGYPAELPALPFYVSEMSEVKLPVRSENNLFLNGAVPLPTGVGDVTGGATSFPVLLEENGGAVYLNLDMSAKINDMKRRIIDSRSLGDAVVSQAPFENPDGTPVVFDTDYFNRSRKESANKVGPFAEIRPGKNRLRVWPEDAVDLVPGRTGGTAGEQQDN